MPFLLEIIQHWHTSDTVSFSTIRFDVSESLPLASKSSQTFVALATVKHGLLLSRCDLLPVVALYRTQNHCPTGLVNSPRSPNTDDSEICTLQAKAIYNPGSDNNTNTAQC